MTRAIRRAWLSGSAGAGMFVFGIVMALLGAALPLVSERIGFGLGQAGNLFLVMNCAMLAAMLSLGMLIDRFGHRPALAGGAVCVAAALAVFAESRTYGHLLAGAALLGAGGGALNGGTNTLISDLNADPRKKASALNVLGVFFGFGALFLPFTIGALLDAVGLRPILYWAAALSAGPAISFAALAFPPAKQTQGVPMAEMLRLARHPLVLRIAFLLFFESANEFVLGGFLSVYLVREIGLSVSSASYVLGGYWGAIMITRIASSRLLFTMRPGSLVLLSAFSTVLAALLLLGAHSPWVASAAVILIGSGCASIYPTVLGEAGSRFEAHTGAVFGIVFAVAMVGGITAPWLVGRVAAFSGLRWALALPVLNAVMIFLLQLRIMRSEVFKLA